MVLCYSDTQTALPPKGLFTPARAGELHQPAPPPPPTWPLRSWSSAPKEAPEALEGGAPLDPRQHQPRSVQRCQWEPLARPLSQDATTCRSPTQLSRTPMRPLPCTLLALGLPAPPSQSVPPAPLNRLGGVSLVGTAPDGGGGLRQAVSSPSFSFHLCKVGPKGGGSCGGREAKQGSFVDTKCGVSRGAGGSSRAVGLGQSQNGVSAGCLRGRGRGGETGVTCPGGPRVEPQTQRHLLSRLCT